MGAICGFHGKLPSHGDFVRRGLPDHFVEPWDRWVQHMLTDLRSQAGSLSSEEYLASPTWRFVLRAGLAGQEVWAGVLVPSVDRVGRCFPLCIAAGLGAQLSVFRCAALAHDWFDQVERIALDAYAGQIPSLEALLEEVASGLSRMPPIRRMHSPAQHDSGRENTSEPGSWRFPLPSTTAIDLGMIDALEQVALEQLGESSLWWTNGSQDVHPQWHCHRGWPNDLMSSWVRALESKTGDWSLDDSGPPAGSLAPAGSVPLAAGVRHEASAIQAAAWTETGKVRECNQDASLVETRAGLWAVADGMGGHAHGEVASRMVIDALAEAPYVADLQLAVQQVNCALKETNGRLRSMAADSLETFDSGTTVVVLLLRDGHGAVIWVGDSRLYRLRGASIELLTRDHSTEVDTLESQSTSILDLLSATTGELTRAVGGADEFEADVAYLQVSAGDRLLLCTDGLYSEVAEAGLSAALRAATPQAAVANLAAQVDASAARDNATAIVVSIG